MLLVRDIELSPYRYRLSEGWAKLKRHDYVTEVQNYDLGNWAWEKCFDVTRKVTKIGFAAHP